MASDSSYSCSPTIEVLFEYKEYKAIVRSKVSKICQQVEHHLRDNVGLNDPRVFTLSSKGRSTINHDYYLLQRWMSSWEAFVNLDSLEQIKNRDRITVCRVSAVSSSDKNKSSAMVAGSKQHEGKGKSKKNRPAVVNVVMLRKFTPKVPKSSNRRQLIKEGRIKSIYISKNADHTDVHSKIKSAFGIDDFVVLDCYNGHHLSISDKKFVDGRLALQRRGCLYLCEELSTSSDSDDSSASNTLTRQRNMLKEDYEDSDVDTDLPTASALFSSVTSQVCEDGSNVDDDDENDVIIIEELSSASHGHSHSYHPVPNFSDCGPSSSFSSGCNVGEHNQDNIEEIDSDDTADNDTTQNCGVSTSTQATTAVICSTDENYLASSNTSQSVDQLIALFQGKVNKKQIEAILDLCQNFDDTLECLLSGPNLDDMLNLMNKVSMKCPIVKIHVDKDEAWSDLVSFYKTSNMDISRCRLRICLNNQPAIDTGGIRCQIYTTVLQKFRENEILRLFDGSRNHLRPHYSALTRSSGMFKVLGSIVGHSIFQDGVGFSHLSPLCYWYIAAGEEAALQLLTLHDVGADCSDFISQLNKATTNEEIADVCISEAFGDLLSRVGFSEMVTLDNKNVVAQLVMQHEGLYKLSILLDQFKEGLRMANILSLLESYPKEFAPLFTFSGEIEVADAIEALYTTEEEERDEIAMRFLHQYIQNLSKKGIGI